MPPAYPISHPAEAATAAEESAANPSSRRLGRTWDAPPPPPRRWKNTEGLRKSPPAPPPPPPLPPKRSAAEVLHGIKENLDIHHIGPAAASAVVGGTSALIRGAAGSVAGLEDATHVHSLGEAEHAVASGIGGAVHGIGDAAHRLGGMNASYVAGSTFDFITTSPFELTAMVTFGIILTVVACLGCFEDFVAMVLGGPTKSEEEEEVRAGERRLRLLAAAVPRSDAIDFLPNGAPAKRVPAVPPPVSLSLSPQKDRLPSGFTLAGPPLTKGGAPASDMQLPVPKEPPVASTPPPTVPPPSYQSLAPSPVLVPASTAAAEFSGGFGRAAARTQPTPPAPPVAPPTIITASQQQPAPPTAPPPAPPAPPTPPPKPMSAVDALAGAQVKAHLVRAAYQQPPPPPAAPPTAPTVAPAPPPTPPPPPPKPPSPPPKPPSPPKPPPPPKQPPAAAPPPPPPPPPPPKPPAKPPVAALPVAPPPPPAAMDAALAGGAIKAHLVRAAYQQPAAKPAPPAAAPKEAARAPTPPPGQVAKDGGGGKKKKRAGSSKGKSRDASAKVNAMPAEAALRAVGTAGDDAFLSKLEAVETKVGKKGGKKKKRTTSKTQVMAAVAAETAKQPIVRAGGNSADAAASADKQWQQVWGHVQLTNLPGDVAFGVGEAIDREPQLNTSLSSYLRPHFGALHDVYHKYSDVHLPGGAVRSEFTPMPFRQQSGESLSGGGSPVLVTAGAGADAAGGGKELKNSDLHRLSENSWLQFCRDARLIGDGPSQLLPTEACLIFTAVNTRRAQRNLSLGSDAESGSIRGFTFSEFLEGIIQCACKLSPPREAHVLLTAESVTAALTSLTEGSILQHVIREDVKGFREAVHASRALVVCLERAAPLLRAVHARYAMRGDEVCALKPRTPSLSFQPAILSLPTPPHAPLAA